MDSILNKKGSSLLEVAVTVSIIAVVLYAIVSFSIRRVQNAEFQRAVFEMQSIAKASISYFIAQGSCPTGPVQLTPTYMPQAVTSSPFNSNYQISCGVSSVSVSDTIPTGVELNNPVGPLLQISTSGGQDTITITMAVPNQYMGRLLYEKNNS